VLAKDWREVVAAYANVGDLVAEPVASQCVSAAPPGWCWPADGTEDRPAWLSSAVVSRAGSGEPPVSGATQKDTLAVATPLPFENTAVRPSPRSTGGS